MDTPPSPADAPPTPLCGKLLSASCNNQRHRVRRIFKSKFNDVHRMNACLQDSQSFQPKLWTPANDCRSLQYNNRYVHDNCIDTYIPCIDNDVSGKPHTYAYDNRNIDISKSINDHTYISPISVKSSNVISLERNRINIRMFHLVTSALIDSGAMINIISRNLFSQLPENVKHSLTMSDITECRLANSDTTQINHKVDITFYINRVPYRTTFYILEQTHEQVILGIEFLQTHLAQIDLINNTITLSNKITHIEPTCNNDTRIAILQSISAHFRQPSTQHSRQHYDNPQTTPGLHTLQSTATNYTSLSKDFTPHVYTKAEIDENVKLLDLSQSQLNNSQKDEIKQIFTKFAFVLSSTPEQLGCLKGYKYDIELPDNCPKFRAAPYRLDLSGREAMKKEIDKLLEAGIIFRSMSQHSHGAFLVSKKGTDEKRLVINFKNLNKVIKVPQYAMPNVEDLLALIGTQKPTIYSKIDIRQAFRQLRLTERASDVCSFTTYLGIFSHARSPMGLSDLPAVFHNIMQELIGSMPNCFFYMDDILLFDKDFESHKANLTELLTRLHKAGLTIHPAKTEIAVKEVEFLGFKINKVGITNNQHNIDKVIKMEQPVYSKGLKRTLGLFSYMRRYVKGYAKLSACLYDKIKGDKNVKLEWTSEMSDTFNAIKQAIIRAPILGFANFDSDHPIVLVTDASSSALGYLIYQMQVNPDTNKLEKKYLFFGGMNLNDTAKRWPIYKIELYAILIATKRLSQYLLPKQFVIQCDNIAVYYLLTRDLSKKVPPVITRWLLHISAFNYKAQHISGVSNNIFLPDFISRSHNIQTDPYDGSPDLPFDLNLIDKKPEQSIADKFELNEYTIPKIAKAQDNNTFYKAMKNFLLHHTLPENTQLRNKVKSLQNEFIVADNNLLYHVYIQNNKQLHEQLCIPDDYIYIVLSNMHDNKFLSAHYGIRKTLYKVKERFYWPKLNQDVVNFVQSCVICAKANISNNPDIPQVLRHVSHRPLEMISVDALMVPTKAQGYVAIFSILDDFSKYLICKAVKNVKALTVSNIIYNEVIMKYGLIKKILYLSDGGPEVKSAVTRELLRLTGCEHRIACPYTSTSNSPVERSHRSILNILRKFAQDNPTDWPKLLPYAVLAYNSTKNDTTGYTPLNLLHNISATNPLDYKIPPPLDRANKTQEAAYKYWINKLKHIRATARDNAIQSKIKQKKYYDRHTKKHKFSIGQTVLLKRNMIGKGEDSKLLAPFPKKYKIIAFQGESNVRLRDMNGNIKPRSFHINKIKRLYERRNFIRRVPTSKKQIPCKITPHTKDDSSDDYAPPQAKPPLDTPVALDTHSTRTDNYPTEPAETDTPNHKHKLSRKKPPAADKPGKVLPCCKIPDVPKNAPRVRPRVTNKVTAPPTPSTPDKQDKQYILQDITYKRRNKGINEYLCTWKGYKRKSWQPYNNLNLAAQHYVDNNLIPDLPKRNTPKIANLNTITKTCIKHINSDTDYISYNYIPDNPMKLPYRFARVQYQYTAKSIFQLFQFIICDWLNSFHLLHHNDNYNIMLQTNQMYQNNNAIYMHLLYYATKIFIENNRIMKDKLMTINQTLVRDSQKCILGYANVIMYILNSIKEPHSRSPQESHLEQMFIPHITLHAIDNDYTRLGHVLDDTPVDKDTIMRHVSCTTRQINTYFYLQSKCRSQ